jgi:hypothetical protein
MKCHFNLVYVLIIVTYLHWNTFSYLCHIIQWIYTVIWKKRSVQTIGFSRLSFLNMKITAHAKIPVQVSLCLWQGFDNAVVRASTFHLWVRHRSPEKVTLHQYVHYFAKVGKKIPIYHCIQKMNDKPKLGSASISSLSEDSIPLTSGSSYQPTYCNNKK